MGTPRTRFPGSFPNPARTEQLAGGEPVDCPSLRLHFLQHKCDVTSVAGVAEKMELSKELWADVARALLPAAPALLPARCRARDPKRVGKSAEAAGKSARA